MITERGGIPVLFPPFASAFQEPSVLAFALLQPVSAPRLPLLLPILNRTIQYQDNLQVVGWTRAYLAYLTSNTPSILRQTHQIPSAALRDSPTIAFASPDCNAGDATIKIIQI